ncbi:MetQ/NlpA family ABC transporter substrate-binding protein [Anaeroselena agilis]|uniref:Lipoprotein n=1 Tax=Anaeroselena agilis TaxID=3063788 RepID=A0ABU3NTP3_9FIRM|nr:MetQ/NlpA family ABC transporter substrate-binding protein [Selenomonadales bacterium 4137-cl]
MKKAKLAIIIAVAGLLAGVFGPAVHTNGKTLKVATTSGPHAEILYAAREMAARDGVTIEILEYDDNFKPNDLLLAGDVDANSFQALPYFDALVADRRLPLVSVAKTVVFPVALYSNKIARTADLPDGATVAIPNDPIGGGRALLLLAKAGVITLREDAGLQAATTDIVANPRRIRIIEVDAADIARRLAEFDLAALGSTYAVAGGLVPARDALVSEGADSPFPHIIAVRAADKDNPAVKALIAAYRSDHVKDYIGRRFQGAVVATW